VNIVYVFAKDPTDNFEYDFPNGADKTAPEDNGTIIKVRIPRTTSPGDVVDLIIQAVADRPINLMRLCAHGNSGKLFLGNYGKGLDASTVNDRFAKLKPYFDFRPGKRREIKVHACYLGSDVEMTCVNKGRYNECPVRGVYNDPKVNSGAGYYFFRGLAEATMTPVHGGVDLISFSGDYDFKFRGTTLYVWPTFPGIEDRNPEAGGLRLDYDNNGRLVG
jgi:hypothetical protein